MTTPHEHTITIRWADVDATQHLRHSAYLDWAAHVRTEWIGAQGHSLRSLSEMRIAVVLLEENIKYLKEIYLGERITVDLACVGVSSDGARWHLRQHFKRGDTICARYEVKGAWLDVDKRKFASPPPGIREAITSLARTDDYADIAPGQRPPAEPAAG